MKKPIFLFVCLLYSSYVLAWNPIPMSKSVAAEQKTFSMKINNKNSDNIAAVKLKIVERTQDEYGQDILKDTKDLLVLPKQIIVHANKSSAVRVLIRKPNKSKYEKSYRLVAEGVPISKTKKEKSSISILMRYLTSIYLEPNIEKIENFNVASFKLVDDKIQFKLANFGTHHKVFSPKNMVIFTDTKEVPMDNGNYLFNVLANSVISVKIPLTQYEINSLKSAEHISLVNACQECQENESYIVKAQ